MFSHGNSIDPAIPRAIGQFEDYLKVQLFVFKTGERGATVFHAGVGADNVIACAICHVPMGAGIAATEALGKNHADTLDTMSDFGVILRIECQAPRSRELHEDVLASCGELFGDQSRETINATRTLANTPAEAGDLTKGIELLEWCLGRAHETLGSTSRDTLIIHNSLGWALRETGELEDATEHLSRALHAGTEQYGESDLVPLTGLTGLALTEAAAGNAQEAPRCFKLPTRLQEGARGEAHPRSMCADAFVGPERFAHVNNEHKLAFPDLAGADSGDYVTFEEGVPQ